MSKKLKDLCVPGQIGVYGIPAPAEEFNENKIRYLRISDISDEGVLLNNDKKSVSAPNIDKYILEEGDIVFARTGNSTGRTYYHEKKNGTLAYAGFLIKYKPDPQKVNPKYLKYFTISEEYKNWVKNLSVGSTRGNINAQTFANCPISLPEKKQQDLLVSILSSLDDKIEINQKINIELDAMVRTLYDYWFVQFDFPDKKFNPYKSSGGKMVFNEQLKIKLPAGWRVDSLSNLTSVLMRGISPKYIEHDGIPVINQKCIRNKIIDFTFARKHDFLSKKVDSKLVQVGDILVNSTGVGTLGRVAIVKRLEEPITTVDSHVTIVRIDDKKANPSYVGYALTEKQSEIEKLGEGSTGQTELSRDNLGKLMLIIPDNNIQAAFEKLLIPIFQKMAVNEKENQELSQLRDWLLPMLMNGQVKVADRRIEKKGLVTVAAETMPGNINQTSLAIPANKKGFAKQVLAGKIVSLFKSDPNFTEIKFQKIQFLAEHIAAADLNLNYYYQAAGPYDNKFMHTIHDSFKKSKWFDWKKKQYIPLEKQDKIDGYYQGYFQPVKELLKILFELLSNATEAESEIISTIYAVWNNRIIDGKNFNDEDLIQDFYNWSERKHQYSRSQVVEGLEWLRHNRMEPKGFGKIIKKAKSKS